MLVKDPSVSTSPHEFTHYFVSLYRAHISFRVQFAMKRNKLNTKHSNENQNVHLFVTNTATEKKKKKKKNQRPFLFSFLFVVVFTLKDDDNADASLRMCFESLHVQIRHRTSQNEQKQMRGWCRTRRETGGGGEGGCLRQSE